MGAIESQFHAKYSMEVMGHSMAAILLIHIGNSTGNRDFIKVGLLYARRFVKKGDYYSEAMDDADLLIYVDRTERSIKN